MEIATLCVNSAYWKHSHGHDLVSWCIALGIADSLPLAVNAAAPMGYKLFERIGFRMAATVVVKGYEKYAEPIEMWLGLRPVEG